MTVGYCCNKSNKDCPKVKGRGCSVDLKYKSQTYFLCPNEASCGSIPRNLLPPTDDKKVIYRNDNVDYTYNKICSYEIAMSSFTKDSDVMYIRLETLYNVEATLIRGAYF